MNADTAFTEGHPSGYTSAMRILTVFAREKRLLLLCGASALLHLAVIASLGREWLRTEQQDPSPRLAVRIGPLARAKQPARDAAISPAPVATAAATPAADTPARRIDNAAAATAPAAALAPWSGVPDGDDDAGRHKPGRQAVRVPPAATLTYAVTATAPGKEPAAAGSAQLDWKVTAFGYAMAMDGVTGSLRSRGEMTDGGFSPLEAQEMQGDGAQAATRFDWAHSEISFSRGAYKRALTIDTQDRASVLMLLAGIGLADPSQIRDVIELYVAGSGAAGAVRFQVVGPEDLSTAMGAVNSIHLMQLVEPGQTRLDVWLAPDHSWYPVQLRVSAPDGSARTQQVTAIAPAQ